MDDEWEWLLDELRIRYEHFEALIEALKTRQMARRQEPEGLREDSHAPGIRLFSLLFLLSEGKVYPCLDGSGG